MSTQRNRNIYNAFYLYRINNSLYYKRLTFLIILEGQKDKGTYYKNNLRVDRTYIYMGI